MDQNIVAIPFFIAIGAVVTYFVARVLPRDLRRWTGTFASLWLVCTFLLLLYMGGTGGPAGVSTLFPLLAPSALGLILALLVSGLGAVAALYSQGRLAPEGPVQFYYPLLLFSLAGAAAVGFSRDLFTLFVIVELSAIPSYALIAYNHRETPGAVGAAMKYLVQGVAGTVTALLGVAVLYTAGHTLFISQLPGALAGTDPLVIGLGAALILIGYGVKIAIVPLHTWLPDAYTLAPAGVTAVLTGATKIGALFALFLSLSALPWNMLPPAYLGALVSILAVVTMTAGNLIALRQTDLRRLLAYSSVAQMGYILLGFGIGIQYSLLLGIEAGLFYAVVYGVMKAGAFMTADMFTMTAGSADISRMKGVGARHPVMGISFTVFIFGLIGVPATAGFLAKLLVFQAGMATVAAGGVILALILAANSALSLGYYVPVLSTVLFQGREEGKDVHPGAGAGISLASGAGVVILALVTVLLGLYPQVFFDLIGQASQILVFQGVR
ncbi:MAG: NADH-quinone oxidoreductase subunit N [Methanoregulaceae archaeon]|nr:NADH-quinone oxidoreductase subunit N [Methanoregulaceae archaeon]